MLMFSLEPAIPFAQALADARNLMLAPHEERCLPDGGLKLRPLVDPRGADANVVHSLNGSAIDSPQDKLCRLLCAPQTWCAVAPLPWWACRSTRSSLRRTALQ